MSKPNPLKIFPNLYNRTLKLGTDKLQTHLYCPFRIAFRQTLHSMAQLFDPGAQFPSRKHLYAARNDFHCLVVLNWNNEHVILLCHQTNAKPNWYPCAFHQRLGLPSKSTQPIADLLPESSTSSTISQRFQA